MLLPTAGSHDAAAVALADPVVLRHIVAASRQDVAARPIDWNASGDARLLPIARSAVLRPAAVLGVASGCAAILLTIGAAAAVLLLGCVGPALLILRWECSGWPANEVTCVE